MKINFERSGGFMGLLTTATIDTQALAEAESQHLHELIVTSGFFDLPPNLKNASLSVPDQFHYKVTITDEAHTHTVETNDISAPDTLRALLRQLTHLARQN